VKIRRTILAAALAVAGSVLVPTGPAGAVVEFDGYLHDVSCATTKACVAVGYRMTPSGPRIPVSFHWNGSSWGRKVVPSPADSAQVELTGVACISSSTCEAVGYKVRQSNSFFADMFAVRWNGSAWSLQGIPALPVNTTSALNAISCSAAPACTAVGYREAAGVKHPLAERWNGSRWTRQTLPALPADGVLTGVSCPTASACTATGYIDGAAGRIVIHWDGRAWTKQTTPVPNRDRAKFAEVHNVTCTSATRCTAVGQFKIYAPVCCSYTTYPLVEKWNGTAWTVQNSMPLASNQQLHDIACSSASACTAVGATVPTDTPVSLPLAYRWNGTKWSGQATGSWGGISEFAGVDCPALKKCFAVGGAGPTLVISRWNGTAWKRQR
jgi:hypothetical protein